jgi:hypothetical protein
MLSLKSPKQANIFFFFYVTVRSLAGLPSGHLPTLSHKQNVPNAITATHENAPNGLRIPREPRQKTRANNDNILLQRLRKYPAPGSADA